MLDQGGHIGLPLRVAVELETYGVHNVRPYSPALANAVQIKTRADVGIGPYRGKAHGDSAIAKPQYDSLDEGRYQTYTLRSNSSKLRVKAGRKCSMK